MGEKILSLTTIGPSPSIVQPQPQRAESRYLFIKELSQLAYGFGDEKDPRSDTLQLLECYMIEYLKDLLNKSQSRSNRRGQLKLELQDIMHYLRDRPKQYNRVKKLLKKKHDIETTDSLYQEEEISRKKFKF
jgi:transcription initiation factor TFIID subunit 13